MVFMFTGLQEIRFSKNLTITARTSLYSLVYYSGAINIVVSYDLIDFIILKIMPLTNFEFKITFSRSIILDWICHFHTFHHGS